MTELVRVGDPLPEITLPDLGGALVALGDLAGRPLIVFMWASW